MTQNTTHGGKVTIIPDAGGWTEHGGNVYRCRAYVTRTGGTFAAVAAGLPAARGTGATEDEAIASLAEALKAQPHRPPVEAQSEEPPAGVLVRWVVVRP